MARLQVKQFALCLLVLSVAACRVGPWPDAHFSAPSAQDLQNCSKCHSSAIGPRRAVTGREGDFGANPAMVSHHVSNVGDPVDAQCLACHDLSVHGSGTVRLWNADTGTGLVYTTPASLEPFCLSCHDTGGAASVFVTGGTPLKPFNDNTALGSGRNIAGNKIQSYWMGSSNIHKTIGALTCAGTGAAGTGCHGNGGKINMHGSVSKGLLTQNLTLGKVSAVAAPVPYDYDYKLCFDCHAGYPVVSAQVILGYKKGGNYDVAGVVPLTSYSTPTTTIHPLFRDQYSSRLGVGRPFYNDMMPMPQAYAYLPLHNYHLLSVVTSTIFIPNANWMTWKYRGDPAQAGRITCVTCHNVHGTNGGSARSTFDEFGITSAVSGSDRYSTMKADNYSDPAVMVSYPMNCAVDCHYLAGQTYYWNSPANE